MAGKFLFKSNSRARQHYYVQDHPNTIPLSARKTKVIYESAEGVWDGVVGPSGWDKVKKTLAANLKGDQNTANKLSAYFTAFKYLITQNENGNIPTSQRIVALEARALKSGDQVFKAQVSLIKEIIYNLTNNEYKTLFSVLGPIKSWSSSNNLQQGKIFEDFIENIVNASLAEIGRKQVAQGKISVGGATSASRGEVLNVTVKDIDGKGFFQSNGRLREEILGYLREELQGFGDSITRDIEYLTNVHGAGEQLCTISVRAGKGKQQKIDDIVPNLNISVDADFTPGAKDFLSIIQDSTFQVKNYKFDSQGPKERNAGFNHGTRFLHVGGTSYQRKFSSFLYVAGSGSKKQNISPLNVGVFYGSSAQALETGSISDDTTIQAYLNWVDFLYEAIGLGQQNTGRLVDYLAINDASNATSPIAVYSYKDLIQNLNFKVDPVFTMDHDGDIIMKTNNSNMLGFSGFPLQY